METSCSSSGTVAILADVNKLLYTLSEQNSFIGYMYTTIGLENVNLGEQFKTEIFVDILLWTD